MPELNEVIEGLGNAFEDFKKSQSDWRKGIESRIEAVETLAARPSHGGGGGGARTDEGIEYLQDKDTGALVPLLRKEHRIAEHIKAQEVNGVAAKDLDFGRLIRAKITGDWRGAEPERKAMGESTGSGGGFWVPSPIGAPFIDLARAKSVCVAAGAGTIPMETETLKLIRQLTDPTVYWRGETAAVTESDMSFEAIELRALSLAVACRVSRELIADAPNANQIIRNSMGAALALEIDRVGLLGTGNGQPRGLFNTPGIQEYSMGDNGAVPTDYDPWSYAVQYIAQKNGVPNAAIMHPRTAGTCDRFYTTDGQLLQLPESYRPLQRLTTTQLPITETQGSASTASSSIVGDFSQMVFGSRQDVQIEIGHDDTSFKKLQVILLAWVRLDVAILRPEWFCRIKGLLAS